VTGQRVDRIGQGERGITQRVRCDLVGPVVAGAQLRNPAGIDIETGDGEVPRQGDGERQADIAEADDGNFGIRRHAPGYPVKSGRERRQ
jgi:hypothetical protein